MKHLQILFIAVSSLVSGTAFAQSDSLSNKFEFSEISLQFGNLNVNYQRLSLNTALQFAPQSAILNNLNGYLQSFFWGYNYNSNFTMAGYLGFKLPKKKHHSLAPTVRMGLLYNRSDLLTNSFRRNSVISTDSLRNSDGVVNRYIQNIHTETVNTSYSNDQLYFDLNLTYAINAKGRFSMFMGVGLGTGLIFNTSTTVTYLNVNSFQEFSPSRTFSYNAEVIDSREEIFRNGAGISGLAYFPIGFDFRIGKRNEAWRKAHVFVELRPGGLFQAFPEANYTLLRSTVASQFGFRFDLRQ
ncbi:MAG: hypothetical protein Q8J69_03630 [Sphingobacteriaceae bacterium]|nr:hypothetical protein [Sphingobacteriaceae bacterium]